MIKLTSRQDSILEREPEKRKHQPANPYEQARSPKQ